MKKLKAVKVLYVIRLRSHEMEREFMFTSKKEAQATIDNYLDLWEDEPFYEVLGPLRYELLEGKSK